jgi:hypothetical protein
LRRLQDGSRLSALLTQRLAGTATEVSLSDRIDPAGLAGWLFRLERRQRKSLFSRDYFCLSGGTLLAREEAEQKGRSPSWPVHLITFVLPLLSSAPPPWP